MKTKVPSPICFLSENDRSEIKWDSIAIDRADPDYEASYDFNVDDYKIVNRGQDANDYGDRISLIYVQRISDGRFFKLRIYEDYWNNIYNGWPGTYNDVKEVSGKLVPKMEWTNV